MLYSERRNALVSALKDQLDRRVEISGAEAGQRVVVKLARGVQDRVVSRRAAEEELWLWPLSPCYLTDNSSQGFILGFGSTPTAEIPRAVRRLSLLLSQS